MRFPSSMNLLFVYIILGMKVCDISAHGCSIYLGWSSLNCYYEAYFVVESEEYQRRLSMFCSTSACWPATRSTEPMNSYLRKTELAHNRKYNLDITTRSQVNGRYITKPRTSEAPFMSGDSSFANNRVHQVNGNRHPVIKCANLAPRSSRHCIA
mmetsp:Transcript_42620/g.54793  ORF Transcript_42620/g.54793 Transcript_42620/m.54793 type:complete len:154 (+) Transcript_42620:36-497(+)